MVDGKPAGEDSAVKMLAALSEVGEASETCDDLSIDDAGGGEETESKAEDQSDALNLFAFSPLQMMERQIPRAFGRGSDARNEGIGAESTGAGADATERGKAGDPLKAETREHRPATKPLEMAPASPTALPVSADAVAASEPQAVPSDGSKSKSSVPLSAVAEAVRALGLPSASGTGVVSAQGTGSGRLSWERGSEGSASGGRSTMRDAEAAIGLWGSKLSEETSVQGVDFDRSASPIPSVSATPAALASALAKPAESVQATASTQPLLAHALDHAASQGQRTLKLQLHPTELGSVTAKLRVSGGALSVELQVETEAAREKLGADNGEAIRAALSALGLQIDSVSVQSVPNGSAAQAGADSGSGGNNNANRQAGFAAESGEGRGNGRGAGGNAEEQGRGGQSERVGGARADGAGRAQPGVFI